MTHVSVQIVRLFNEERALLMLLAAKRDVAYADVLRMGLYQLGAMEGFYAEAQRAVQRRVEQVLEEEAVGDGIRAEETTGYACSETAHGGGVVMDTDNGNPRPQRPRTRPRQAKHPIGPERRVLCRRCQSGVLTLFMCGPRLRGRCQDCGTVWVYLWSCTKQGWFQWSN
jgi:hypothetical protein